MHMCLWLQVHIHIYITDKYMFELYTYTFIHMCPYGDYVYMYIHLNAPTDPYI